MNTPELKRTPQSTRRGTVGVQLKSAVPVQSRRRWGVNDTRYWEQRLRKRVFQQNGQEREGGEWMLRLKEGGRGVWFPLRTANRADAANLAREIGLFSKANGLEATEAKYKRAGSPAPNKLTVGDYLRAVQATARLEPRTFLNYANCLRTVCAGVYGIRDTDAKFDYRTGGNQKWRERLDSIRLERLTTERVSRWTQEFVAAAGKSPGATMAARRTVNSYVRCARSLFSSRRKNGRPSLLEEVQKRLGVALPSPLPLQGVGLFEAGSSRYRSTMNVEALITAARNELKKSDPEAYKVFLLGLFGGLRRGEIDGLEWRMVDFAGSRICLEETEWLSLKTQGSADDVSLEPEVLAEIRSFMNAAESPFVVASDRPARGGSLRPYYRCKPVFDRLTNWLRSKGIAANKPLHELRKEVGAVIATKEGIYAASRFLRHSDITTTARHYADQKERVTSGMGCLLASPAGPRPLSKEPNA